MNNTKLLLWQERVFIGVSKNQPVSVCISPKPTELIRQRKIHDYIVYTIPHFHAFFQVIYLKIDFSKSKYILFHLGCQVGMTFLQLRQYWWNNTIQYLINIIFSSQRNLKYYKVYCRKKKGEKENHGEYKNKNTLFKFQGVIIN